jgi:hypothetical protein
VTIFVLPLSSRKHEQNYKCSPIDRTQPCTVQKEDDEVETATLFGWKGHEKSCKLSSFLPNEPFFTFASCADEYGNGPGMQLVYQDTGNLQGIQDADVMQVYAVIYRADSVSQSAVWYSLEMGDLDAYQLCRNTSD